MAVRKVRIWPDPALKEKARPVSQVDAAVKTLVDDMFETMYKANGIGLAANQLGVSLRVVTIDLDPRCQAKTEDEVKAELESWGFKGPAAFINPEIKERKGEIVWEEGCLSVPGVNEDVKRSEHVVVRALNVSGEAFEVSASGLYAVCLQHEIDHLNGRVFVDYLSKLKRDVIRRKMERLREEEASDPPSEGVATL